MESRQACEELRLPVVTASVLGITAAVTTLQFFFPVVVAALQRTPGALSAHEWWRLITPVFVNPEGWSQIAFNFSGIAIAGTIVERFFGRRNWLILYFGAGLVGESAGFSWQPSGAGASVAVAGLLGGLATWLWLRVSTRQARAGASSLLILAVVLTAWRDIHGPPLLAGMGMAFGMLRQGSQRD